MWERIMEHKLAKKYEREKSQKSQFSYRNYFINDI